MPLNSMQQYVKGLLDGAQLPLNLGTLQVFITPPDPGDGTEPTVYIWGSIANERRQSMPRHQPGSYSTGGFKLIDHAIDLWLTFCGYADDEMVDSQFPIVIDAVCAILRDTLMPKINVIDEVTGQLSDILSIGEKISWDYAPVRSLDDQRMLRFTSRIVLELTEKIQA